MLLAQAHSLDAIFNDLARRAALNVHEYLNAAERYLRSGLKAQSQCRATIEALGNLKNPRPIAYVGQMNNANGPQQVNNSALTQKPLSRQNELLEQTLGTRLDAGAAGTTGGADTRLEALGAVNRAEDDRGQG